MLIKARKLLSYSTEELWDILTGSFILVFDDQKQIETNDRQTLYSSYFWDFHRSYPKTPLLSTHHVSRLISREPLSSKTHIDLLTSIYWDTVEAYKDQKQQIKDSVTRLIYEVTNRLYNDMVVKTEKAVMSIDILDFLEINNHPAIQNAFDKLEPTPESVDHTYQEIMKTIRQDPSIGNNSLTRAVKSRMVNANQVLQCIGPRGFVSEVDGAILVNPVMRSYTQGMRTLYNEVAESRTAAKALYFSESPLQDSEYFARRLQLVCMTVEKLSRFDCGSTQYLNWRVKPPVYEDGREIYPGDLKFLVGKYYFDPIDKTLKAIQKSDKHLNNTVIQMRSVLYCKDPNPHHVCEVCFGQMADNIADHMNLGHVCSATMTRQTTQSVLSTKHLDASSTSNPIQFTEEMKLYFQAEEKTTEYRLKPSLKTKNLRLTIASSDLFGFTDILQTDAIEDMDPSRISSIEEVGFTIQNLDESAPATIKIGQMGRKAVLSTDFLKYAKMKRWSISAAHNFVFDMSDWDYSLMLFKLPDMEYSFAKHSKQIAEIIESKLEALNQRNRPESPVRTLQELFDMTNSKISVNLSLLEVIIYAMEVYNQSKGDMYLARNSEHATLGVRDDIIRNRSLSASFGYEAQMTSIMSPQSFFKGTRPDHPLDVFMCPKEVLEAKKN